MRPDSYHTRSPDAWDVYGEEGANVAVNKTVVSERGAVILCLVVISIVSGLAWARSESAIVRAEKAERESRLLMQQTIDMQALLLREGILHPGDLANGPAGNLQYQPKRK